MTVLFRRCGQFQPGYRRSWTQRMFTISWTGVSRSWVEEIHKAGGSINQYTGDGVMALFGAPTFFFEDHVERACHAAIQHSGQDAGLYGPGAEEPLHVPIFQLRIGINTGKVVVGAIGIDLRDATTLQPGIRPIWRPGCRPLHRRPGHPRFGPGERHRQVALSGSERRGLFAVKGKTDAGCRIRPPGGAQQGRKRPSRSADTGAVPTPFVNRTRRTCGDAGRSSIRPWLVHPGSWRSWENPGVGKDPSPGGISSCRPRPERPWSWRADCLPYGEATAFYPVVSDDPDLLSGSPGP